MFVKSDLALRSSRGGKDFLDLYVCRYLFSLPISAIGRLRAMIVDLPAHLLYNV